MKNSKNNKTICIAAGGTGGHVIPAMSIAVDFLEMGYQVVFITDHRGANHIKHFNEAIINSNFICKITKLHNKGKIGHIINILLFKDIIYIFRILQANKVKLLLGFGSYVSTYAVIAAFLKRTKIIIHEQNILMGLGNRISCFFAKKILLSFNTTYKVPFFCKKKVEVVGLPLRKEFRNAFYKHDNQVINYKALYKVYYHSDINIFIMGGSQGAKIFTTVIPSTMLELKKIINYNEIFVYHQCNANDVNTLQDFYSKHNIQASVSTFFTNTSELMSKSHILISRSGSGTIFEIMSCGTPSILVPYQYATDNHQLKQAEHLQKIGACVVIEEKDLTPNRLIRTIKELVFSNNDNLFDMSAKLKNIAKPGANQSIIKICNTILGFKNPKKQIGKKFINASDIGVG